MQPNQLAVVYKLYLVEIGNHTQQYQPVVSELIKSIYAESYKSFKKIKCAYCLYTEIFIDYFLYPVCFYSLVVYCYENLFTFFKTD